MNYLFLNLAKILKKQNKTINELLEAARRHNLALRRNNITAVLTTANEQEELSRKLNEQDRKREEIQRKLAVKYGLDGRSSLKRLLPHAGAAAMELGELSRSLKENLKRVSDIKNSNDILARSGQLITDQLLRAFKPKNGNTYLVSGKMKDRDKQISIVDKTI